MEKGILGSLASQITYLAPGTVDNNGEREGLEPVHPYCVACGALVGFAEVHGNRRAIHCTEILLDPKSRVDWGSMYRAIFRSGPKSPYQLSGVGRYDAFFHRLLKAPWDRNLSNINIRQGFWHEDNPDDYEHYIRLMNFVNSYHEDEYPCGHIIHSTCWTILEAIIGPSAEKNLEVLLDVFRERWDENPFEIHEYVTNDYERHSTPDLRWRTPPPLASTWEKISPDLCYEAEDDIDREIDNRVTKDIPSLRDPLNTSELHKLVKWSKQDKVRENTKRKTRRWAPPLSPRPQQKIMSCWRSQLPLDTALLILDNLSSVMDVKNALIAFAWNVPDVYWRERSLVVFVPELGESIPEDIRWKSFFMGLGKSPDMQNRKRVLDLLNEVKRRFSSRLPLAN